MLSLLRTYISQQAIGRSTGFTFFSFKLVVWDGSVFPVLVSFVGLSYKQMDACTCSLKRLPLV